MPDRDNYTITKIPPEQYSFSEIKTKEINEETRPLNEYQNGIIIFDDVLGTSSSKFLDQSFTRGKHKSLNIIYHNSILTDQKEPYGTKVGKYFSLIKH